MEKIEYLFSELNEDKEFFLSFKDEFINFFTQESRENVSFLDVSALRSIADRLYLLLFSFNKTPIDKLKEFIEKVAQSDVDLKPVFSKSFLYILKNYIDYVNEKGKGFDRIKILVELLDIYLSTVDIVYVEYSKNLEKEIEKIKKERLSEETGIIFHGLKKLMENKKEIKILDFYKEVPVVCKAVIKDIIKSNFTIIKLQECKYKNFYVENKEIYIKSDIFPKTVKCTIKETDLLNDIIKVGNFHFADVPQDKRRYLRVKPHDNISIFLIKGEKQLVGKIEDISIGGVGVSIKEIGDLKPNDKVKLRFELREVGIENIGVVRYIRKENGFYRIGIEFEKNDKAEEAISEYVVKTQFEIIKEIRV